MRWYWWVILILLFAMGGFVLYFIFGSKEEVTDSPGESVTDNPEKQA
jgi:phosphotransferase system  glucose/maltose/N-acetylglucosamine-specific IIC component